MCGWCLRRDGMQVAGKSRHLTAGRRRFDSNAVREKSRQQPWDCPSTFSGASLVRRAQSVFADDAPVSWLEDCRNRLPPGWIPRRMRKNSRKS